MRAGPSRPIHAMEKAREILDGVLSSGGEDELPGSCLRCRIGFSAKCLNNKDASDRFYSIFEGVSFTHIYGAYGFAGGEMPAPNGASVLLLGVRSPGTSIVGGVASLPIQLGGN